MPSGCRERQDRPARVKMAVKSLSLRGSIQLRNRRLLVWVAWSGLFLGLVALALRFDEPLANLMAGPWASGQRRAVTISMRAWGEGGTIAVILIGIAWVVPSMRRNCARTALACLVAAAFVVAVKPMSGRLRPDEVRARGLQGAWHVEGGVNSSFPSGHVATAFAFARGLVAMQPALAPLCYTAAAGTGLSRMADGRHYLSDTLVGGLLGWLWAGPILKWKFPRLGRVGRKGDSSATLPIPKPTRSERISA